MLSGSDLCKWSYIPKEYRPLEFARALSRKLGCYDYDSFKMVQCLRQRSAREIMTANIWVPLEMGGSPWRPVVDANDKEKYYTFLDSSPHLIRQSGQFYNISVMFGVTFDEGAQHVKKSIQFFHLNSSFYFSFFLKVIFDNLVNIPNIQNGLRMSDFENILRDYVHVRAKDYYRWVDYQNSILYADSNYYIDRLDDFIDEDGIFRALQYRYTDWSQPENTTTIRQNLVNVRNNNKKEEENIT
jgi:hypothetical protein